MVLLPELNLRMLSFRYQTSKSLFWIVNSMKSIGKLLNHRDLWLLLIHLLQLEAENPAFLMDGLVCTGDFVDVEGCENNTLPRKFKNGVAGMSDLGSNWALGIDWGVCLASINITCF